MVTTEQIKAAVERKDLLKKYLDIENKKTQLKQEEILTHAPDFWDNQPKAEEQMRKIKSLKFWVDIYENVEKSVEELNISMEFFKEEVISEQELDDAYAQTIALIENLEMKNMLRNEEDKLGAVLKIVAGAGGTEAQDWAEMLMRMYLRWAEANGYKSEITNILDGDEAGIKSVTFEVDGALAYGYAKAEKGVHRLVRISPFDAAGRRHTSFAAVEVMPVIDEEIEVNIAPEDLRVDTYRASGAGGQHINKTDSAIRLTHIPTGVVVSCQSERSQKQNKETAMKMLKAKLFEIAEAQQAEKISDIKGVQKEIAWGSQIRSYVFHPYNMVKDHRTNFEVGNIGAVMDGELDGFINAYLKLGVNFTQT